MVNILIEDLYREIKKYIDYYKPTNFYFLTVEGGWGANPIVLRDRISNELFHRFWIEKDKQKIYSLSSIIDAVIFSEESWTVINKIIEPAEKSNKKAILFLEFLYQLIELNINKINNEIYVPE